MDKQIRDISKKRTWKRILRRSVALLCAVVMLFTMNTLKRNADTLEHIPMCGYAEHVHSASCFSGDVLVCGMEEHIHTDACYQTRPSDDVEVLTIDSDEDIPVEEVDVELGDLVLDVDVGDLVLDEPGAVTVNESAPTEEEKYFILSESAKVSTIIKELELGIKRKQIEAVGAIENDEEHIGLIRVDALEKDWLVSAAKDFDEAELAIVLADDIVVVKLKDGRVSEDLDTPVEEQVDIEAPAVDEQIEQTVVDEQEPVIEEQPIEVKQIEVPSVEESAQPAEVQAQPAEDEMPVEETVPAEEASPEEEQTTEEAPPAEEQLTEESAPVEGEQSDEESAPVEEQPVEAELSTDDEQQPAEDAEVTAEETAPAEGAEALAELPTDDEQYGYEQPVVPAEEQGEEITLTEEQGEVDEDAVPTEEQGEDGQQPEVVAPVDEEQGEDDAPAEEHGESAEKSEEDMQPEGTASVDEEQGEEGVQSEEVAPTGEQGEGAQQPEEAKPVGEEQSEDAAPAEENEETTPAEEQGEDAQQAEEVAPVEEEQGEDAQQPEEDAPVEEEQGEDAQQAEETAPVDEEQTEDAAPGEDYEEAEAEEGQSEEQGEQQPEAQTCTATIDLTDVETYPLSLNAMLTAATPEQEEIEEEAIDGEAQEDQAEEQTTLTIEYDEALLEVVEQDGDYLVTPIQSFESTQIIVNNGSRYELTLVNCVLATDEKVEDEGEQQEEARDVPAYTATIDLTDATYPLSLNELITAVTPEQDEYEEAQEDQAEEQPAEEQPTLTIDYDEALLEVVEQDGDYLVRPVQSFESTQIIVTNGSRYELTLVNCVLTDGEQEEQEVIYPAQAFEDRTDYVKVSVTAPEGAFPEGTTMTVTDVEDEQTITDIEETVSEDFVEVKRVHAVDISFWNGETEIEPLVPISVVISVAEIEEQQDAVVVHVDNEGATEVVESQSEAPAGETEVMVEMPASEAGPAPSDAEEQGAGQPAEDSESPEEEQTEDVVFSADSFSVYAVVVTETIETKYIDAEGETWNISVGFTKEANIPAGAKLDVSEVESEDYLPQAEAALEGGKRVAMARFFDISILDSEGAEVQPAVPVTVNISLDNMAVESIEAADHVIDNSDPVAVAMHFEESDESVSVDVKETTETEEAVVFDAESFSVWGVVYTVDFYFGDYEYHLPGEGYIALSDLFGKLEIEADAAEAKDVVFSNPELVAVVKVEEDTALSQIMAEVGLDDSSEEGEQTEDEIVPAGTRLLVSLAPFDTHETLTVTMENGVVYEIMVEDAKGYSFYFNVNDPVAGCVYARSTNYASEISTAVTDSGNSSDSVRPRSADEATNGHLSATRGYYFVGWLINGTTVYGTGATEVGSNYGDLYSIRPTVGQNNVADRAQTFTACFAPDNQYLITFDKNISSINGATGSVSQGQANSFEYIKNGNINDKGTVYYCYSGSSYGAYAEPAYGSKFVGWYYGDELLCSTQWFVPGEGITEAKIATARFVPADQVTVTYRSVDVSNNNANINRIKVLDGREYSGNDAQGNPYQDTEIVYENRVPSGATSSNTTGGASFVGWRDNETGKLLTRDYTLSLNSWAEKNRIYTAEYVFKGKRILFLAEDNHGHIYKGEVSENVEQTGCTDGYDYENSNVCLKRTYHVVPEPDYVFDHWEFNGEQLPIASDAIRNIGKPENGNLQILTAVFKPITNVVYDIGVIQQVGNNTADWQHWVDVPWCRDNIELVRQGTVLPTPVEGVNDCYTEVIPYSNEFTLPDLSRYTRVSQTNNAYNLLTHTFKGWKMEWQGEVLPTIYPAGTSFHAYGSCRFIAVWDAYFPGKGRNNSNAYSEARYRYNTNTCGFFVRLFDSTFDKGDTGTYTDCLFTTRLLLSGSGSLAQDDVNGVRFDYYGNSDAWEQNVINDIDSSLRANANSGLTYNQWKNSNGVNDQDWHSLADNTTIKLELDFPSDDFIFSRIRAWNLTAPSNRKIQINGHDIPQYMLTTDYFDIKWYVLKDQENSWHIDGMLIPKYAKLRVTKTFVGSAAALELAKSGFTLNVTETSPRSGSADTHQLVMGNNSGEITWTYTSNGTKIAGMQNGNTWTFTDDGNRVAKVTVDTSGNGIAWTLYHLIPMTAYTVTESAYDATGYTTIKTYQIENTPQETNLEGSGDSASVDCVYNYGSHVSESSYQTVGFTNLYTTPFVMTLMKQDGTTLRGLSNVTFDFEVRQGDAVLPDLSIPRTSNADGQITIEFPHEAGTYSFTLVEREHEGYNAISTITGTATVDSEGAVTLSDVNASVSGDSVLVSVGSPDPSIVYVKNMPERKQVRVTKTWTDGSNGTVVMQLMRNGVTMSGMYITLPYSGAYDGTENVTLKNGKEVGRYTDAWTYQWTNLPAYINGREVVYSVQEEWIGELGGVDSIHYNIANDSSDGYADYIVNQSQAVVVNGETTYISVYVENTPDNGQVKFSKVDASGKAVVGAVFTLYQDSGNNDGPKIPLETVKDDQNQDYNAMSDSNGVVTIENLPAGWYWMKETTAPVGYKLNENWYLVRINARNSAIYTVNQTTYYPDLSQAVQTIINEPFTAHVKVVKKGISDLRLSGAVFSLHRTETSEVPIRGYASLTTDANGEIDLGELKQGTYWLKEIIAPEGYQLLTNRVAITVTDDRNAEPEVVSATLDSRKLTTTESSGVYNITVPNEPTGRSVKLRKKDAVSGAINLQGARFKIYIQYDANYPDQGLFDHTPYVDNNWINSSRYDCTTQEFISDETYGRFYVGYLPVGSYTIVETQAPNGYERIDEPFILTVYTDRVVWRLPGQSQQSTNGADVYIKNIPIGSISVSKTVQVDGVNSPELAGQSITFGLFGSQPTAESVASRTYSMTLGQTATTTVEAFTGLHMGTYWVYEVDADNHPILDGGTIIVNGKVYTVSEATPNVTLESAGDSKTVSITNNYSTVDIPVMKIWDGNSKPNYVTSVDFTLYTDAALNTVAKDIDGADAVVILSSENGWRFAFTDLPEKDSAGATIQYYLKETRVTCKAIDAATGVETTFEVTGNAITDMFGAVPGTYTGTNGDAQIVNYRTITNTRQFIEVDVEKMWDNGTWPEKVTSVQVTLKANNEAANVTADTNGNAATVTLTEATENAPNANKAAWTHLPKYDYDGNGDLITYTVEETAVTYDGTTYTSTSDVALADRFQIIAVQPTTANSNHATITNRLKETQITVLKRSAEATHQSLPGAEFMLDRKNNGVYTVYGASQISGADGVMTFSDLPDGDYRLEETGIPAGYARTSSGRYIYFKIAEGVVTWDDTPNDAIKRTNDGVGYNAAENNQFTVDNTPGVRLPSTGGTGTTIIYAAGIGLIAMALFGLMLRRRKARDVIE